MVAEHVYCDVVFQHLVPETQLSITRASESNNVATGMTWKKVQVYIAQLLVENGINWASKPKQTP